MPVACKAQRFNRRPHNKPEPLAVVRVPKDDRIRYQLKRMIRLDPVDIFYFFNEGGPHIDGPLLAQIFSFHIFDVINVPAACGGFSKIEIRQLLFKQQLHKELQKHPVHARRAG